MEKENNNLIGLTFYLEKSNSVLQYTAMYIKTYNICIKIYIKIYIHNVYKHIHIKTNMFRNISQRESLLCNTQEH